jgi:hypothetical protein
MSWLVDISGWIGGIITLALGVSVLVSISNDINGYKDQDGKVNKKRLITFILIPFIFIGLTYINHLLVLSAGEDGGMQSVDNLTLLNMLGIFLVFVYFGAGNWKTGILWIIFFSTYVTFYNEYESSMRAEFYPPQPYKPYESSKSELREEKCKNEFNARYSNNNVSMSEMKKRQLWLDRCRYSEPY